LVSLPTLNFLANGLSSVVFGLFKLKAVYTKQSLNFCFYEAPHALHKNRIITEVVLQIKSGSRPLFTAKIHLFFNVKRRGL